MPELTQKEQAIAAEYKYWKERHAQLEARTDTLSTPDDRHQGRQYQADWADAFHFHGREPPMQREGESPSTYNRRLGSMMQEYSQEFKGADLHTLPDYWVNKVLPQIRKDALNPQSHKVDVPAGVIKKIRRKDKVSGRDYSEFISSDNRTFIHEMTGANPRRRAYTAGGKFINPLGFQAYGRLIPTDVRDNSPESLGRDTRQPMRGGLPR